ncbi:uncharacterized protein LOC125945112 [Dermacentor silvarum]|uniref:uncharacterized protein LOC125945112 n=1 Tax=Dermacentor silvarum TaxID=543639 RepID=UPI002100A1C2|nr:uncharacterized protein LOC125945112 [Dermacentor silvarum]
MSEPAEVEIRRLELQFELQKMQLQLQVMQLESQERIALRRAELEIAGGRRTPSRSDAGERLRSGLDPIVQCGKVLKGLKLPCDADVPLWFDEVERVFTAYDIPPESRVHLVMPALMERVRYLLRGLSEDECGDYDAVKAAVLNELKLTPPEYLDRFETAAKRKDETWAQFASRVETYFDYYLRSREATTKDEVVQLVVADRMKASLSPEGLEYVRLREGESWLRPAQISRVLQTFEQAKGKGRATRQQMPPAQQERETPVAAPPASDEEAAEAADGADTDEVPSQRTKLRTAQLADESLKKAWADATAGKAGMFVSDGLLYHWDSIAGSKVKQLVLPASMRQEVLLLAHESLWGGHLGPKKTKLRIKYSFFWPGLEEAVKRHCRTCHGCQVRSDRRLKDRVPITPLTRPDDPFQVFNQKTPVFCETGLTSGTKEVAVRHSTEAAPENWSCGSKFFSDEMKGSEPA